MDKEAAFAAALVAWLSGHGLVSVLLSLQLDSLERRGGGVEKATETDRGGKPTKPVTWWDYERISSGSIVNAEINMGAPLSQSVFAVNAESSCALVEDPM